MAIQAQLYSENNAFGLGASQDLMIMENASGFNQFCPKTEKQIQQHQHQHMQFQSLENLHQNRKFVDDNNTGLLQKDNHNGHQSMNLAVQIEKQRLEIDGFISLQSERLRWALQEQRKQQLAIILKKYEAKTQFLLSQKDEEISKATNKAMELENFLKKLEIESQAWQRLAKENEAMVLSLNNKIEQLKQSAFLPTNGVEDAESCCDVFENGQEINNNTKIKKKMVCKNCNFGDSFIVMLPCRHLCLCKGCEVFFDSCPVCGMQKQATVEALI